MISGFDFDAVKEFEKATKEVQKEMRKDTTKFMKDEAKKLRKATKAEAKSTFKKKTGNYQKGFKYGRKVYKYADADYNIMVYNSAPHAHLLESGHALLSHDGSYIGFVQGRHVVQNSAVKFESEFDRDVEDVLAEGLKKKVEK